MSFPPTLWKLAPMQRSRWAMQSGCVGDTNATPCWQCSGTVYTPVSRLEKRDVLWFERSHSVATSFKLQRAGKNVACPDLLVGPPFAEMVTLPDPPQLGIEFETRPDPHRHSKAIVNRLWLRHANKKRKFITVGIYSTNPTHDNVQFFWPHPWIVPTLGQLWAIRKAIDSLRPVSARFRQVRGLPTSQEREQEHTKKFAVRVFVIHPNNSSHKLLKNSWNLRSRSVNVLKV